MSAYFVPPDYRRICAEAARFREWWAAKPDKVYAHQADRIHWLNAEAICGRRLDRRRAYYLHGGEVMVHTFDVEQLAPFAAALITLDEEQQQAQCHRPAITEPRAAS